MKYKKQYWKKKIICEAANMQVNSSINESSLHITPQHVGAFAETITSFIMELMRFCQQQIPNNEIKMRQLLQRNILQLQFSGQLKVSHIEDEEKSRIIGLAEKMRILNEMGNQRTATLEKFITLIPTLKLLRSKFEMNPALFAQYRKRFSWLLHFHANTVGRIYGLPPIVKKSRKRKISGDLKKVKRHKKNEQKSSSSNISKNRCRLIPPVPKFSSSCHSEEKQSDKNPAVTRQFVTN